MQTSAEALDSFLRLLLRSNGATDKNFKLEPGRLLRFPILPRRVQPAFPSEIPLYIGKIRTDLLAASAVLERRCRNPIRSPDPGGRYRANREALCAFCGHPQ